MKSLLCFTLFVVGCFALEFEENDGSLHEGDIKLSPEQKAALDVYGDPTVVPRRVTRGLTSDPNKLWPLTVPYTVSSELQQVPEAMDAIKAGIREWEERSCLKFVIRTVEQDYIEMFNGSGCWSYVGKQGGKQQLSLKKGCWSLGTVAHEIAHAMGIWHEQSRPDRDNFVDIVWSNIPDHKQHNFRKYNRTQVDSLGVSYDYLSVMHYSATAFSSNGQPTIVPKDPTVSQLGQRVGLAPSDAKQIDLLYKCGGKTTRVPQPVIPNPPPPGPDTCDFENGFCGFVNVPNGLMAEEDDFDWTMRLGKTPSGGTGPETDHTTGRWGRFIYIETSYPRVQGDRAVLRSKLYTGGRSQRNLHFVYHMLGIHIGSLFVDLEYQEEGSAVFHRTRLWQMFGNQGNKWIRADIPLPVTMTKNPYRILFTGVRGSGFQGDIAIDDVYFSEGNFCQ